MKNRKEVSKQQKVGLFVLLTRNKSRREIEEAKNRIINEEKEKLSKNIEKAKVEYEHKQEELEEIEKIFNEKELSDEEVEGLRKRLQAVKDIKRPAVQKKELTEKSKMETAKRIKKERRRIIEKNAKSAKVKVTLIGISSALTLGGIGIGASSFYALNEAKARQQKELTVDALKYPDGINVENVKNDRQVMLDGLNAREYVQKTDMEKIKERVTSEVDSLKSGDDILNYLKGFYVTEYNERYGENITKENVTLYVEFDKSDGAIYKLYNDVAENGDKIIRKTTNKDLVEGIDSDLISATVKDEEKNVITSEYVSYRSGVCTRVYDSDEYVESYEKKGCLLDIGNLIRQGVNYYAEMTNDDEVDKRTERSLQAREENRKELIQAVTEYEQTDKHFLNQEEER